MLVGSRGDLALGSVLLLYLTGVVVVAAVGGLGPGLLAAGASVLTANWFLVPPYHTLVMESRDAVVELAVFAVVALVVSVTVELAARNRAGAARARAEAALLAAVTGQPAAELDLPALLELVRTTFAMDSVSLVGAGPDAARSVIASVGDPHGTPEALRVGVGPDVDLVAHGPRMFAEDRRALARLGTAVARAWEAQRLAERAGRLAETDRIRSSMLAAVGHDLRTPLSGLKASVSSLRQDDVTWTAQEAAELLASIEDSADRLAEIIANILDLTRIQVGAVIPRTEPVAVDEVMARALLDVPRAPVRLEVPDDLPLVLTDAGLLERILVNLLDNAARYSPPGRPAELRAALADGGVEVSVLDHGPGVPAGAWATLAVPFQRLGDRSSPHGAGLGLAIVHGFAAAMDLAVTPAATPGGGLTVSLVLPLAMP